MLLFKSHPVLTFGPYLTLDQSWNNFALNLNFAKTHRGPAADARPLSSHGGCFVFSVSAPSAPHTHPEGEPQLRNLG